MTFGLFYIDHISIFPLVSRKLVKLNPSFSFYPLFNFSPSAAVAGCCEQAYFQLKKTKDKKEGTLRLELCSSPNFNSPSSFTHWLGILYLVDSTLAYTFFHLSAVADTFIFEKPDPRIGHWIESHFGPVSEQFRIAPSPPDLSTICTISAVQLRYILYRYIGKWMFPRFHTPDV